jgi:hypothetical protein
MRKGLLLLLILVALLFPSPAASQNEIRLSTLEIQLWPEYDQPSMLVIYDFVVASGATFPLSVSFRLPLDANLIAVASYEPSGLINAKFEGPTAQGEWQILTVIVESQSKYHFEYYRPLIIQKATRKFNFLWPGDYAVDSFSVQIDEPLDVTSLSTTPALQATTGTDGRKHYVNIPGRMDAGQQYTLDLQYEKTSDKLVLSGTPNAPSAPLDQKAVGRISLSNLIPYILGSIGVMLILGGLIYFWSSRGASISPRPRRRRRVKEAESSEETDIYCHQCGQRARPGDRFCRVCGTRLRLEG